MEIPMRGNTKVKELYNDVDSSYNHVVVLDLKFSVYNNLSSGLKFYINIKCLINSI